MNAQKDKNERTTYHWHGNDHHTRRWERQLGQPVDTIYDDDKPRRREAMEATDLQWTTRRREAPIVEDCYLHHVYRSNLIAH